MEPKVRQRDPRVVPVKDFYKTEIILIFLLTKAVDQPSPEFTTICRMFTCPVWGLINLTGFTVIVGPTLWKVFVRLDRDLVRKESIGVQ